MICLIDCASEMLSGHTILESRWIPWYIDMRCTGDDEDSVEGRVTAKACEEVVVCWEAGAVFEITPLTSPLDFLLMYFIPSDA
jgi:hypothetical protein